MRQEAKYAKYFRAAIAEQYSVSASLVKSGNEQMVQAAILPNKITEGLRRVYEVNGVDFAKREYKLIGQKVGVKKAIDPLTDTIENSFFKFFRDYMGIYGLDKAKQITDTTKARIANLLILYNEEGYGEAKKASLLLKEGTGVLTRYRARLISRTENVTASNMGARQAAEESGLEFNKKWKAANQFGRTRPDHYEMNSKPSIPMNEKFKVGGEECDFAGDSSLSAKQRCNCRCVILYEPIDIE